MVGGSNPSATTRVGVLPQDLESLTLRELLEMLLGEDGKRRLRLRYMTNDDLFACYDSELLLRNQSKKGLYEARRVLRHFQDFLGQYPPTPELGRQFLAQFAERKVTTKYRYAQIVGGFFDWYGEKLGVKVRVPRKLPEYTEERDVSALLKAIENKATHKKSAEISAARPAHYSAGLKHRAPSCRVG